jgi:hypothetical protein
MTDKAVKIMQMIMTTKEKVIGCDECYLLVDRYVDLLESGADPAKLMPDVEAHFQHCGGCQEEFKALLTILRNQIDAQNK